MKKFWFFGDSFTAGTGCLPNQSYYEQFRKDGNKIWVDWIKDIYNIECINDGVPGASNDMILDNVIKRWDEIKEGDLVFIGKTLSERFDVPINNKLEPIRYHFRGKQLDELEKILTSEQLETILNFQYYFSEHSLYKERQDLRFEFVLGRLNEKKINTFFWYIFLEHKKYETIVDATNGKIHDNHWSFDGHKNFANFVSVKFIKNYVNSNKQNSKIETTLC